MVRRISYLFFAVVIAYISYGIYSFASLRASLSNLPKEYVLGSLDGDLTVVEFFDYGCDHCRSIHPIITEAVRRDGKIRYVPLPLMTRSGGPSTEATRLTYAAAQQGKYGAVFDELITNFRSLDDAGVTDLALKLGLDAEKLKTDAKSPAGVKAMDKSGIMFRRAGGEFTPTFMIGSGIKYVPDTKPSVEDFLRMFREARRNQ